MRPFNFNGATFNFPIKVYTYFDKTLTIAFFVIMLLVAFAILFNSIIAKHIFGIWLSAFIVLAVLASSYLYKKPRFIIEKDKLIVLEHGLIKPKQLYWQDCTLHATFNEHHATKKEIALLHFCYQDNKNEMQRFAYLGLNNIRFDDYHFDKDDTLKFFEQIKSLSEKS